MIIVKRNKELNELNKIKPPFMVFGRRKTGKTFFIKNNFPESYYFFIRKDKSIFYEKRNEVIRYEELIRIIDENKEKTIIIDEFHRLPNEFLDYLHMKSPNKIILITSSLFISNRLLKKGSPILGLFLEFKFDIMDPIDIIKDLEKRVKDPKKLVELAVYLREPLLLKYFELNLFDILKRLKITAPALIGEIFDEEKRELGARYEGILRAISSGKSSLSEITSFLYSNKVIVKEDISAVKPYMGVLINLGIIKRISDLKNKRKSYFYISSPMIDLFYYLDEKYNFSETDLDEKFFLDKLPRHVESFYRDLLSKKFKKNIYMINKPDYEIDMILTDFKKPKIVAEVKWKNKIKKTEIDNAIKKFEKFPNCEKYFVVPNKNKVNIKTNKIKIVDIRDFLK